uniref:Uncharacterized protein n=1 Tax=Nelumbo nucifera TaxID=4432 RepID=A0A822YB03_NELNU|nr:TPA_asm: hypothetical protein HUJ06_010135 [Nelumbo nucifera]
MGRSDFLAVLLFSALLAVSFSQGYGRKYVSFQREDSSVVLKGNSQTSVDEMDYTDPGPNTNPRSSFLPTPPPAPVPQG